MAFLSEVKMYFFLILVGLMSLVICRYVSFPVALAAFLGAEGTVLLAFAFSAGLWQLEAPKGFFRKICFWYEQASKWTTTISFNPVLFWLGLSLIVASIFLSAWNSK